MNAEAIATRLRDARTPDEAIECVRACDTRRTEVRALIDAASPPASEAFPVPPRRARAAAEGLAALDALDREIEKLQREMGHLGEIERSGYERAEALKVEAIRSAAPKARAGLPRACKRVRDAVAELDAAIEALRPTVETLGGLAALRGEAFPLTDQETAELLAARELVWTVRTVPVLTPPMDPTEPSEAFKRSHELIFERRGGAAGVQILRRGPPQRIDPTEYGEPLPPRIGRYSR